MGMAVFQYAEQELGDIRKLAGSDVYRLRVGDWRVLFSLHEGGRVMLILRILNRRDAYQ
ncbi:MAG: type II toxin-antitoxin system RelE/ParE family toxin [Chloroflexota bacterium]